jgi:DNA-binding IclR family transcriptional regulator
VFLHGRQIAGALTLTMPAHRYKAEYIGQLVSAAKDLSARIA